MSLIYLLVKPTHLIIGSRYDHSTLSYALLVSNLMAIESSLPICFCILWRVSKATRILSEINLLLVNALWCLEIIFGRIFLILFAKTFENILYKTLQRLIGLKFDAYSREFFLGMGMIKVWLRLSGRYAELRKCNTDWVTHHYQLCPNKTIEAFRPVSGLWEGPFLWLLFELPTQ